MIYPLIDDPLMLSIIIVTNFQIQSLTFNFFQYLDMSNFNSVTNINSLQRWNIQIITSQYNEFILLQLFISLNIFNIFVFTVEYCDYHGNQIITIIQVATYVENVTNTLLVSCV